MDSLDADAINGQNSIIGTAVGEDGFCGFVISPWSSDYTWLTTWTGIPVAINDSNTIVGIGYGPTTLSPYLWHGTKRYNLNNLLPYGTLRFNRQWRLTTRGKSSSPPM